MAATSQPQTRTSAGSLTFAHSLRRTPWMAGTSPAMTPSLPPRRGAPPSSPKRERRPPSHLSSRASVRNTAAFFTLLRSNSALSRSFSRYFFTAPSSFAGRLRGLPYARSKCQYSRIIVAFESQIVAFLGLFGSAGQRLSWPRPHLEDGSDGAATDATSDAIACRRRFRALADVVDADPALLAASFANRWRWRRRGGRRLVGEASHAQS